MQFVSNIQASCRDDEAEEIMGQYFFHCDCYFLELERAPDILVFCESAKTKGEKEGAAYEG